MVARAINFMMFEFPLFLVRGQVLPDHRLVNAKLPRLEH
jgi:hypothetical protein